MRDEKNIHKQFKHLRLRQELFVDDVTLRQFILAQPKIDRERMTNELVALMANMQRREARLNAKHKHKPLTRTELKRQERMTRRERDRDERLEKIERRERDEAHDAQLRREEDEHYAREEQRAQVEDERKARSLSRKLANRPK